MQPKTDAQKETIKQKLLRREQAKREQLAALGIDYDFKGYANKVVVSDEKVAAVKPAKKEKAKKVKSDEVRSPSQLEQVEVLTGASEPISLPRRRLASRPELSSRTFICVPYPTLQSACACRLNLGPRPASMGRRVFLYSAATLIFACHSIYGSVSRASKMKPRELPWTPLHSST